MELLVRSVLVRSIHKHINQSDKLIQNVCDYSIPLVHI